MSTDTTAPVGERPHVVVVTRHWGEETDERAALGRLLAGALARAARVSVVHLVPAPLLGGAADGPDSVFRVYRRAVHGSEPLRGGIARAALLGAGVAAPGRAGAALLEQLRGEAPEVPALVRALGADAVVLLGHDQPYELAAACGGARVVAIPLLGANAPGEVAGADRLLARADVVLGAHPGEIAGLAAALPPGAPVVPLDLALTMNRAAVRHRLFGVRWFGRYVVALRGFPARTPRHVRSVSHEMLRRVLGRVAVAEVDDGRWRITDGKSHLLLPVNPSRVNLWRLMEHALMTIDLRPPGPIGREAIESLLLATPVVVPDGSAAMAHARAADGGLWYRDLGECFDAARVLLDRPLRERLGEQGARYALAHHGDMDGFVARIARLVLG